MVPDVSTLAASAPPSVVSGASETAPPQQKMTSLFNQIDTAGAGAISQAQFSQAFQSMPKPAVFQAAGANAIWSQLDPSGGGQITQQQFVSGMKTLMVQLRQDGASGSTAPSQTASNATQALNALVGQSLDITA